MPSGAEAMDLALLPVPANKHIAKRFRCQARDMVIERHPVDPLWQDERRVEAGDVIEPRSRPDHAMIEAPTQGWERLGIVFEREQAGMAPASGQRPCFVTINITPDVI